MLCDGIPLPRLQYRSMLGSVRNLKRNNIYDQVKQPRPTSLQLTQAGILDATDIKVSQTNGVVAGRTLTSVTQTGLPNEAMKSFCKNQTLRPSRFKRQQDIQYMQ